jgi:hypothetical protein
MSDLTFGLFVRGQYHAGDDMRKRFEEVKAQVRLADQLGFSDLLTGMHYAAAIRTSGWTRSSVNCLSTSRHWRTWPSRCLTSCR